MPSIIGSAITNKAVIILQDTTNVRWPVSELLGWLNDGQREICIAKPDACVQNKSVQLIAGTKQSVGSGSTSDAVMFFDVVRNMGTNGTTAGNAVRAISREIMDAQTPDWHTASQSASVTHFMYDPRDPKRFYVYPPNTGTGYVEVVYGASPTALTAVSDTIAVDDIYANALLDYILYRAYSKDAKYAANGERAVSHYQAFANALGIRDKTQMLTNPNLTPNMDFNPNVAGAAK